MINRLVTLTILALSLSRGLASEPSTRTVDFQTFVSEHLSGDAKTTLQNEMKENQIEAEDLKDVHVILNDSEKKITIEGEAPTVRHLLFAGIELGSLFPIAIQGTYMQTRDNKPFWDVDVKIEPSGYYNSLSVGGAYHPFDSAFFVGARIRELFLHSPFSREYNSEYDASLGLGGEAGFRWRVGAGDNVLLSLALGATYATSASIDLPVLVNANAGVSIRVFELFK